MATVLFVHGTGVRKPSYIQTTAIIQEAFEAYGIPHALVDCLWGDDLGSRPPVKSIPDVEIKQATKPGYTAAQEIARWELLYRDPFFELRLLKNKPGKTGPLPPSAPRPDKQLWARIQAYQPTPEVRAFLKKWKLEPFWDGSWDSIIKEDRTAHDVLNNSPADIGEPGQATARAVVAALLNRARAADQPLLNSRRRDELVHLLVTDWKALVAGIGAFLANFMKDVAASAATPVMKWNRAGWSESSSPVAGDILLYQAHGGGIRNYIAELIEEVDGDVYLLSHSLGGIACVDLLRGKALPKVKGLITVGSQAPLLYEIGALSSLGNGVPPGLPPGFPPWLNVYDPYDFLSYVAEPVFQGDTRITDRRIESGQPFPESHSAYWTEEATWIAIRDFLQ